MSTPVPPHYTAFRVTIVVVLLLTLAAAVWLVVDPAVLGPVLRLLGPG